MSLNDKLNRALSAHKLQPLIPKKESMVPEKVSMIPEKVVHPDTIKTYLTLEDGIKAAKSIKPDEFGTRIVVVEKIKEFHQLPMTVDKYIIDDIQKRSEGNYEIHLLEKNQR